MVPKKYRIALTAERARELLSYDPDTGIFVWKARLDNYASSQRWTGKEAGTVDVSLRSKAIFIDNVRYFSHRIAWLWMTGEWPHNDIDHINRNGLDNRWVNLRQAEHFENMANTAMRITNTSGYRGVCKTPVKSPRWAALVHCAGTMYRSNFTNKTDAAIFYNYHSAYLHGEFGHLNKIKQVDYIHD